MIDKNLNYGRIYIEKFLKQTCQLNRVLDLGSGHGDDLLAAKKFNKDAELLAIENFPKYIEELNHL